jgi:hypothetical protein
MLGCGDPAGGGGRSPEPEAGSPASFPGVRWAESLAVDLGVLQPVAGDVQLHDDTVMDQAVAQHFFDAVLPPLFALALHQFVQIPLIAERFPFGR